MDEQTIKSIIEGIGDNTNREGVIDTPKRVLNMYKELFRGYNPELKPKITTFYNGADGLVYNQMICDTGDFYSHCEHHMVPFFGKYWFAYIPHPNGKIIGLSKVARIVDYYSAKLQIQERLGKEVIEEINKALDCENPPYGIAIILEGTHLCKVMRGVKKKGVMRTTFLTGVFDLNVATRAEFLDFVNRK